MFVYRQTDVYNNSTSFKERVNMSRDNTSQQHAIEHAPAHRSHRYRLFKLAIPILFVVLSALFFFGPISESVHAVLVDFERSVSEINAVAIVDWPYDQTRPAIAYNMHADEYFVTWQNQLDADSDAWYIFGRRTDETGFPAGSPLAISDSDALAHVAPDITYHKGNQDYIVVWENVVSETDHDIFARRLNGSGEVVGEDISISALFNKEVSPVVEANTTNGEYLVVWSIQTGTDDFPLNQIVGKRLNATGTPTGTVISIGPDYGYQLHPALAYDSQRNRYLIVWQEQNATGDFDIMGQRINGNGDLIGATIEVAVTSADQLVPRVAYNPDAQQYLVVWEDHSRDAEGAWDVRGQRLNADGGLVGAVLPIAETYLYHRLNPDVAYKSGAREYWVVWENEFQADDHDIFQRRIADDGSFPDIARSITNSDRFESRPAIASDNAAGFVTAWEQDNSADDTGIDIFGAHIQVSVTPATPTPTHTATPTSTSQPAAALWLPMYLR